MATYGKRDRTKAERLKRLSGASTSAGSSSTSAAHDGGNAMPSRELVTVEAEKSLQNGDESQETLVPYRMSPRLIESPEMETAQSEPPQANSTTLQLESGDQLQQEQDASSDISSAPSSSSSLETGRLLLGASHESLNGLSRASPVTFRKPFTATSPAVPQPNLSPAWPATQPFPLPAASSSRLDPPSASVGKPSTAYRASSSSLSPEPTDSDDALPSRKSSPQPNGTDLSAKLPEEAMQRRSRVSDVYGRARTRQGAPQSNKGKAPAATQEAPSPEVPTEETRRSHSVPLAKETDNEAEFGSPSSSSVSSRSESQPAASTSRTPDDHPGQVIEDHALGKNPSSSPSRQQPSRFLAKRPPRKHSSHGKTSQRSANASVSASQSTKPAPLKRKRNATPEPMPSPAVAEAHPQAADGVDRSDEPSSSSLSQGPTEKPVKKRSKANPQGRTETKSAGTAKQPPLAPEEPVQTRARASESRSKQNSALSMKKAEVPQERIPKKAPPKAAPPKKPRISLGSSPAQPSDGTQQSEQREPVKQTQKGKAKGKQVEAAVSPPAKSDKKKDAKQVDSTRPAAPKKGALKSSKPKASQPDKAAEPLAEEAESPDMPSTRRQTRRGGQRSGVRFAPVESEDEYSADDLDELPFIDDDESLHPPAEDVRLYTAASDDAIALIIPGIWHSRQCLPSFAERFPDKSLREVKAVRQAVMMWRKFWIRHKLRVTVYTCDKSLITELEHKIRDKRVAEAVVALREEYLDKLNATEGVEVSVDYLTEEKNADAIRLAEVDPLEALAAAEAGRGVEEGVIE